MTNGQLLNRAREALSPNVTLTGSHLAHAIKLGYVTPTERHDDGAFSYDDAAVQGLTTYMLRRSRTARREMAEASNA